MTLAICETQVVESLENVFIVDPARKAKKLFYQYLTPKQKASLLKYPHSIICIGNETGKRYELYIHSALRNVFESGIGYCSFAFPFLPMYDVLLIKKLMIENDENYFLEHSALVVSDARPIEEF